MKRVVSWSLLAAILVSGLTIWSLACDPGHQITYENQTDRKVHVLARDVEIVKLEPRESAKLTSIEFGGIWDLTARDDLGRVVYAEQLSWEDLKQKGWKIIISEQSPATASPSPNH